MNAPKSHRIAKRWFEGMSGKDRARLRRWGAESWADLIGSVHRIKGPLLVNVLRRLEFLAAAEPVARRGRFVLKPDPERFTVDETDEAPGSA